MRERCGEPIPSEITNRKIGWQEVMSGRWHGSDLLERWLNMVTLLLCTAKVDLIKSTHGHIWFCCGSNQKSALTRTCTMNRNSVP